MFKTEPRLLGVKLDVEKIGKCIFVDPFEYGLYFLTSKTSLLFNHAIYSQRQTHHFVKEKLARVSLISQINLVLWASIHVFSAFAWGEGVEERITNSYDSYCNASLIILAFRIARALPLAGLTPSKITSIVGVATTGLDTEATGWRVCGSFQIVLDVPS